LCSSIRESFNTTRVSKSRGMRYVGHGDHNGEIRNACRSLVGKF
jgi:hypothetical protein